MINFSDGIRHLYLNGLKDISTDIRFGVNEWIQSGKDYIVGTPTDSTELTMIVYDLDDYLRPYAFDINRLSCAAIESLNDIQKHPSSPKFDGWTLTKYYYSAFFSAHSILRLTGYGILNVDGASITAFRKVAKNYIDPLGHLNSGLYCNSISSQSKISLIKNPQYDDSHKGLWKRFLHFIVNIQNDIYNNLPQTDAQLVVDKLNELKDSLTNWGANSGEWLSRIRNLNNYSQYYGVWYPYNDYDKDYKNILKYKQICKENPLKIELASYRNKEISYFVRTCQLINSINFDIQKDLVSRHFSNKSFLLHGIFEYHNQYAKKINFIT